MQADVVLNARAADGGCDDMPRWDVALMGEGQRDSLVVAAPTHAAVLASEEVQGLLGADEGVLIVTVQRAGLSDMIVGDGFGVGAFPRE